jgi:hypothetical protein
MKRKNGQNLGLIMLSEAAKERVEIEWRSFLPLAAAVRTAKNDFISIQPKCSQSLTEIHCKLVFEISSLGWTTEKLKELLNNKKHITFLNSNKGHSSDKK